MNRYVGILQSWSSHLHPRNRKVLGVIYDTTRRRGKTGDPRHDFAFVEYTAPDELREKLFELNQGA